MRGTKLHGPIFTDPGFPDLRAGTGLDHRMVISVVHFDAPPFGTSTRIPVFPSFLCPVHFSFPYLRPAQHARTKAMSALAAL